MSRKDFDPFARFSVATKGAYETASRRKISSYATGAYKFVLGPLFVGVFGLVTLTMILRGGTAEEIIPGLLATGLVGAYFYWSMMRLKEVKIDDSSVYISNYKTTIKVPLGNIAAISGSVLISPELVWLEFRRPTEFGRKIVFAPKWRIMGGFGRHSIVEELTRLVADPRVRQQQTPVIRTLSHDGTHKAARSPMSDRDFDPFSQFLQTQARALPRQCPKCGLRSLISAMRCDCGYDFSPGTMRYLQALHLTDGYKQQAKRKSS